MAKVTITTLLALFFIATLNAQVRDSTRVIDTISIQKERFKIRKLYIPVALMGTGLAFNSNRPESFKNEIAEERNEHFLHFGTSVDNYLQYSPIAIAYGLDALGVKSKTDLANRTAILLKGGIINAVLVTGLKKASHQLRPDGSNYLSFPSGHTANAFAAATFLSEEYKYKYKWMPYAAYSIAGSVGILRMANNRHYISDVLVGAGIGILSMKLSYWTHQYKWGKKRH
ncbi:MAG TPA: phosphatase PAP2 family protein [Niabella sp.]|nr:phosphatase PAP2 family protein [Niabella sp.]HQX72526.1 phosphatase PAP2 family protein [Chitinophagaceae bacterium]HQW16285.1 phosphatase PAP2 family protein [Niabella sp.]HQX21483.1 phosphatase PAP2 family protein [Niabella sp.]HRB36103.1 phosphatase PAP2 family protein [Niabella sp.]